MLKAYRIERAPADAGHLRKGSLQARFKAQQKHIEGRGDDSLELILLPCHIHLR